MMNGKSVSVLALASGSVLVTWASAQQVPPPESGDKIVNVTYDAGQVTMRDAATGAPLMMPRGILLYDAFAGSLAPSVKVNAQPAGFDVVYTFTNSGSSAMPMARMRLGIFTLGNNITYHDFRGSCGELTGDYNTYKPAYFAYPTNMYSPVWVMRSPDYAVGVSIQYPVIDYKHDVRVIMRSPSGRFGSGEGGRGWEVEFRTSNVGDENENSRLYFSGTINPGETRTYVASVRVTKAQHEWVRALVPYRNYFRSVYGGPHYTRDPRPINAVGIAQEGRCTESNPYGYAAYRPDTKGWTRFVSDVKERHGWARMMLWTPTGHFRYHQDLNFPFQFTTNLNASPELATAFDTSTGLASIPRFGRELGLWWGRSVQVMREWDPSEYENFDPDKPDHVALAYAELDDAMRLGATIIGLDTFSPKRVPMYKLYPWLKHMKERHPGVKFVTEPIASDLIHSLAPSFFRGYNDRDGAAGDADEVYAIKHPHYLADFLLPGHEIWGGFRYSEEFFGDSVDMATVRRDMESVAAMGFAPCFFVFTDLPGDYRAAESWTWTVPADLQLDGDGAKGGGSGSGGGSGAGGDTVGDKGKGGGLGSGGGTFAKGGVKNNKKGGKPGGVRFSKPTVDGKQAAAAIRRAKSGSGGGGGGGGGGNNDGPRSKSDGR